MWEDDVDSDQSVNRIQNIKVNLKNLFVFFFLRSASLSFLVRERVHKLWL